MTLTLAMITTNSTAPEALARWWAAQTGAAVTETNEGYYVTIAGGSLPLMLAFQWVEEVTPGRNKLHLDLTAADPQAEVERLVAAGAALVEWRGNEDFRWATLTDPDGNEFCVAGSEAH